MLSPKFKQKIGEWQEKIVIDGQTFRAELIDPSLAGRSELGNICALDGLPSKFVADLVRSAQVVDMPHMWRAKEVSSIDKVTDEIFARGKKAIETDISELGANIITYLAEAGGESDGYKFLAAGAIRDKLTRDFQSEEFPVVSRAVVKPDLRGRGLGSMILTHRLYATLKPYFSLAPKAIHMGTESEKILHILSNFEKDTELRYVHIGNEHLDSPDGVHLVRDYLCFLPAYQEEILNACDVLASKSDSVNLTLRDLFKQFMDKGVSVVLSAEIETEYKRIVSLLESENSLDDVAQKAIGLIDEFFLVKTKIGAEDPE